MSRWQLAQKLSSSRWVDFRPLWSRWQVAQRAPLEHRRRLQRRPDVVADGRMALEAGRVAHLLEGDLVAGGALLLDRLVREQQRSRVPEAVAEARGLRVVPPWEVEHAARGNGEEGEQHHHQQQPGGAPLADAERGERQAIGAGGHPGARLERAHQLHQQGAVVALGRRLRLEAIGPDVHRLARDQPRRAHAAGDVLVAALALEVHQAVAVDHHAVLERHARVGEVDLAARVAAHAQPLGVERLLHLAARAGLDDEQYLHGATSR
jgi:hypothetical protein